MTDPLKTAEAVAGAVEASAKTAGKVVDVVHGSGRWLEGKIGGVITDAIGFVIGDPLSAARQIRQIRLRDRVLEVAWQSQQLLESRGVEALQIPSDKVLIPLLQGASIEDDVELQKLWAELLASSMTEKDAVQRSFISVLGDLTPTGANALREYFEETPAAKTKPGHELGISYIGETMDGELYGVSVAQGLGRLGLVEPAMMQFMVPREPSHLTERHTSAAEITVPRDYYRVVVSEFGAAFCKAVGMCAPLKPAKATLDI